MYHASPLVKDLITFATIIGQTSFPDGIVQGLCIPHGIVYVLKEPGGDDIATIALQYPFHVVHKPIPLTTHK